MYAVSTKRFDIIIYVVIKRVNKKGQICKRYSQYSLKKKNFLSSYWTIFEFSAPNFTATTVVFSEENNFFQMDSRYVHCAVYSV